MCAPEAQWAVWAALCEGQTLPLSPGEPWHTGALFWDPLDEEVFHRLRCRQMLPDALSGSGAPAYPYLRVEGSQRAGFLLWAN